MEQRPSFFGGQRCLLLARDDAGLLEQPLERRGSAEIQLVAGPADQRGVRAGLGHVDREVGRGRAFERRHVHADLDAAALDRALDQAPCIELEGRERARQPEGDGSPGTPGRAVEEFGEPEAPAHAPRQDDGLEGIP